MHNVEQLFLNNPEAKFIVIGDFNLRNIKWNINNGHKFDVIDYVDPDKLKAANIMQSIASLLNLSQIYPDHPSKGYTLDLIFAVKKIFMLLTMTLI